MGKPIVELFKYLIMEKLFQLLEVLKILLFGFTVIFCGFFVSIWFGVFKNWFLKKMEDLNSRFKDK